MIETLNGRIKWGLYTTVVNLTVAAILSLILGFSWPGFAKIALALALNIFGVPIYFLTDIFGFPLWVWYVIALYWVGELAAIREVDA